MANGLRLLLAAALATGLAVGPAAAVTHNDFKGALFYGDSLVDAGRTFELTDGTFPPSPPYFEGRASNGPVWAEYTAQDFARAGLPTGNFAFAGAHARPGTGDVPGLALQIGFSIPQLRQVRDLDTVAAILIGSNDIFSEAGGNRDIAKVGAAAAASVAGGAVALHSLGIDHVLFFTLPPLELTPRYTTLEPDLAARAARGADAFNATLAALIPAVKATGLSVGLFDLDGLLTDAIANPGNYGFTNVTDPCLTFGLGGFTICDDPDSYLFWDDVHPTAAAHRQIGALVSAEIAPAPLPAPLVLLAAGVIVLGAASRWGARWRS